MLCARSDEAQGLFLGLPRAIGQGSHHCAPDNCASVFRCSLGGIMMDTEDRTGLVQDWKSEASSHELLCNVHTVDQAVTPFKTSSPQSGPFP